jgi:O-antigen/teichoic acid export membrane protein
MTTEVRLDPDQPGSVAKRVAKNTAYLALADAAGKTMSFFYYLLAARRLGVEMYGVLSFAIAFTTMLGVLADLGLGTIATREIARDHLSAQPHVDTALSLRLVASVVVVLLVNGLAVFLGYPGATVRAVFICSVAVMTNAISTLYYAVFQGFERMGMVTVSRAAQTVVLVGGAVLLAQLPASVASYAFVYAAAGLVSVMLAAIIAMPRLVRPGLSLDVGSWWRSFRASAPVGLATVFTTFYYWMGTTLLSKMSGNSAVGNYSAAFRLATGLVFVGLAFSGAVYPLFSRLFVTDSDRLARVLERSTKYMMWVTLPAAAFGTVFARPAVSLLYGGEYQGAWVVLRVVVWWGAFASLNSLFSNYLVSVRRARFVTFQTGLSLAVNLVLALLLIPAFGATGAAVALAASEMVGLACLVTLLLRSPVRVRVRPFAISTLRVLLALGLAVAVAVVVSRWNISIGLASGITAYCVLLFSVGGVGRDDLHALRPLFGGAVE